MEEKYGNQKKLNEILQKLKISELLLKIIYPYYKENKSIKEEETQILLNSKISNKLLFSLSEYYALLNDFWDGKSILVGLFWKEPDGRLNFIGKGEFLENTWKEIQEEYEKIKD